MRHHWIAGLALLGLLIGIRCLGAAFSDQLPNFSPLPAVFLCSMVFFRGTTAWLLPLAAWLISDPLVSALQGWPIFGWHHLGILGGLSAALGIGLLLRRNPATATLLGASLLAALAFYFVTNLVSFLCDPLYTKTLAGFVQAQWSGPTGYAPTWVFLRNLAAANLLFSALFLAARPAWRPAPAAARDALAPTR